MIRTGMVGPVDGNNVVLRIGNTFIRHPNSFGLTVEDLGKQFVAKFDPSTITEFNTATIAKLVLTNIPGHDELLRNWAAMMLTDR